MAIEERREQVAGLEITWREAPARGSSPVLYVHGVPTDGRDWLPFLERTGGYALDLPGFGRSDKPPHFDYSIDGYERFLTAFADHVGLERFQLVVHDWGSVGLMLPPERIERVVVMNAVPFLPGYRWHRAARIWRTPLGGELAMGVTFKWTLRRGMPDALVDSAYEHFDHGTQRAILKLYRSAPPELLARVGERLGEVRAPALVLWPEDDPYIGAEFGQAQAEALGGETTLEMVHGGHWPWLRNPELIARTADFLKRS
jgi:pimeloyl-ACP methyl ester carboxylesterase